MSAPPTEAPPPGGQAGARAAAGGRGRVFKAVVNYGLGSYLPQFVNFLLVPVYTRYIAPGDMAALETAFSIQTLLLACTRGLPAAVSRLFFDVEDGSEEFKSQVATITAATFSVLLLLSGGLFLGGPPLFRLWFPEVPFFPFIALGIVSAVLMTASDFQRRLLQAREHSAESARLNAVLAIATTVLTLTFVMGLRMGARGAIWATFIVSVGAALYAIFRHWREAVAPLRWKWLVQALKYGLPLVPNHVGAWLQQNIGRFFLLGFSSAAQMGVLAVASKVASPLVVVTGAFSSAYAPVYFSWRAKLSEGEARAEAHHVGTSVALLGAVAVIGAGTAGAWVMRFLMSESYRDGAGLVGIIAGALFLQLLYTLISMEVFYSKRTRGISVVFVSASALNAALLWRLAPAWGAMGAALAQLAGGVLSLVVICWLARATFPLPLKARQVVAVGAMMAAAAVAPALTKAHGALPSFGLAVAYFLATTVSGLVLAGALRQVVQDVRAYINRRRGVVVGAPVNAEEG